MLGFVSEAPAAAERSWAQPQINAVVAAGLLADDAASFAPDKPLTQRALAGALDLLALDPEHGAPRSSYRAVVPSRSVTIRELDAALVGFLGLGGSARAITAQLRTASVEPRAGAGTETVARLLGLRFNHPAARDELELGLNDPATRAEAAYSLARLLELSSWDIERVRSQAETFLLPELTDWQRSVLRRAVSFVGSPYIWGGTSELPQRPLGKPTPGGFDCSTMVPVFGAAAPAPVM